MQLGNTEIHVVNDGITYSDGGGVYGLVPRVLWEAITPPDDKNRVQTTLNCLLVVSQGKKILVDNGLGSKFDAKAEANWGRTGGSRLIAELGRLGVRPEDIDIVINTHLHADHCGGNTRREGSEIIPTFPRAAYWIQRLEWADASFPNERTQGTYFAENFRPPGDQARLVSGDVRVTDEVRCIITPGHTRSHQSVLIESQGQKVLFLADMAGRSVYMERLAWVPSYDLDPMQSIETKRRIRDWAVEEQALLIFQHDPLVTMGWLGKDGDRYRIEKVG